MTNKREALKSKALKHWKRLTATDSELKRFADARRENSSPDYDEEAVGAAFDRRIDEEVKQAGEVGAMFHSKSTP